MIGKTRYQVRLFLNEKSKEFTAMADSGNRLVEPVTGKPVSIIAAADAKEFLGEKAGVLMIPYRAVGTENGMLPGVLFDRMEVMSEECGSIRIERQGSPDHPDGDVLYDPASRGEPDPCQFLKTESGGAPDH